MCAEELVIPDNVFVQGSTNTLDGLQDVQQCLRKHRNAQHDHHPPPPKTESSSRTNGGRGGGCLDLLSASVLCELLLLMRRVIIKSLEDSPTLVAFSTAPRPHQASLVNW